MEIVVVDASVLVEIVLGAAGHDAAVARTFTDDVELHAPHLVDVEVLNAVRRLMLTGAVAVHDAVRAVETYRDIPVRRYPHVRMLDRIVAVFPNVTPYDAAYVALAEVLDAPLVTFDATLARAPGITARIEVLRRPDRTERSEQDG